MLVLGKALEERIENQFRGINRLEIKKLIKALGELCDLHLRSESSRSLVSIELRQKSTDELVELVRSLFVNKKTCNCSARRSKLE